MKIRIVDELTPEDVAMLQALYSRSAASVDDHIIKVKGTGSGKFMASYYVGYGHKSIADCGSTTIFIEDVSLLAAKAIQDWPLYSGQETSTRYIDMGAQRIADPLGTPESKAILDRWMDFYRRNQERVFGIVCKRHPIRAGEAHGTYERAVKARVFDIMRAFLPAGVTTQLSWHTNLRQAGDHLAWMRAHPLDEIRSISAEISVLLNERYPASGFNKTLSGVSGIANNEASHNREQYEWMNVISRQYTYSTVPWKDFDTHRGVHHERLAPYRELLRTRPRGCVLPHFLSDLGQFSLQFPLDFGSFRDLQRHRNGVIRMPLLDCECGFNSWYLDQLPHDGLEEEATELVFEQANAIRALQCDAFTRQYYVALGFQVPCQVTMALPALVYFLELRSQKTVHPTLRYQVRKFAEGFRNYYPDVALHDDREPDDWTVRRGEQTITERS